MPALAYDTIAIDKDGDGMNLNEPGGEMLFVWEDEKLPAKYAGLEGASEELHFNISDEYFISEDGQIYYNLPENGTYAACSHIYQWGYNYKHESLSNGGCNVKKYKVKRCTQCGHIASSSFVETTTRAKCPH